MIVFPNCKINLGLCITSKRNDGYHNLETVFYPLPLYDVLEIIRANGQENLITTSGYNFEEPLGNNLCMKAYALLKKHHSSLPPVTIHLHKTIPAGAGLGGGSADAAFTLKLLNEKFGLNLSDDELIGLALQLGSDCPFFIHNKPSFATGRGEVLHEVELDLSAYKFIIVNPGIHISTAAAFRHIIPSVPGKSAQEIIRQPVETWKSELRNDFEQIIFAEHPEIAAIKQLLYERGAEYAAMSGSGSTIYGIFKKEQAIDLHLPPHFFIKELNG